MSEEKTVLLSIKLDTGDLKKNAEEASEKLLELKAKQLTLDKSTKEGALAFAQLGAEIKAQNLVLNQSTKSIEINERLGNKQNLSLKEQGELLSAGKVALRNLTAEQIANTESGQQLNKEVSDLNESLKKSEAGYGVHTRNVGNYSGAVDILAKTLKDLKVKQQEIKSNPIGFQQSTKEAKDLDDKINKIENSLIGFQSSANNSTEALVHLKSGLGEIPKETIGFKQASKEIEDFENSINGTSSGIQGLKAELRDLKSIMVGLDAGSEEYQQASARAGELADKIKEINENVNASSGGTGFEQLSNNLGLVQDDLMNLDFAGVSEKMKQMAVISKGMTFKEVIGGVKNMGSALLSLGKAILANPLFLMVGAIVAIVGALKMWSDYSAEQAVKAQDKHTLALEKNIETIKTQQKTLERSQELELKRAELEGKGAEELGKIKLKHLSETNKKQIEEQKAFNKLSQDLATDIAIAERQGNEDRKADLEDKKEDAEKSFIDLFNENLLYEDKRKNLILENNVAIREETKNATDKRLADEKANAQKRLDFLYKLADLQLANEDKANANSYKRAEIKYTAMLNDANNSAEDLLQIQKDYNTELDRIDEEAKKDDISKLNESKKREIKDAEGNKQLLTEIERKYTLEKTAINKDYENKKNERDAKSITDTELYNKAKLESERKTTNEIKLIDAELNYLKSKGNENEKAMFEAFQKTKIQVLEDNAKKELLIENQTVEQKDLIRSKLALETEKINNEEFKKTEEKTVKETEKKLTDKQLEQQKIATVTLNSAMQLTDAISQMQKSKIQNELEEEKNKNDEKNKFLKEQLDANLITEAEYNTQKSAIDAEYKANESKLKTEAFKKEKQANIIKATMSTAVGVVGALPNIPLSILAGILGAAQIALIAQQQVPKFAKGGVFGGNSHSNGGTKGVFSDGTQIEVERDENFYILNKNASRHINGLSNLNQQFGGIPLMANGGAVTSSGIMASSITNGVDANLNAQNQMMRMIEMMPKPVVVVQDINDAQGNLATVENRANF